MNVDPDAQAVGVVDSVRLTTVHCEFVRTTDATNRALLAPSAYLLPLSPPQSNTKLTLSSQLIVSSVAFCLTHSTL